MLCPHCRNHFHDNQSAHPIRWKTEHTGWILETSKCPNCEKLIIELEKSLSVILSENVNTDQKKHRVFPRNSSRPPAPDAVPPDVADDYSEACLVLTDSPKASAALARRCLQSILHNQGYKGRDLAQEIDLICNETDPEKVIPRALRKTIDMIRHFGNFSAHPITDKTSLQVIAVEPQEAETCLDVLEALFDHFYVQPALLTVKREALNQKLVAAGKPPIK